jgi:DNA-binding NarL/FixJ family response regulator
LQSQRCTRLIAMPLTILIAEDDPATCLSIHDYLQSCGYFVVSANNGRDALMLLDTHHPHLIITDISMPQMDGYEFIRQVRQRPVFRLLPVVLLTGRTQPQERVRGYQLGCDVYLSKPFELSELGAIVRNLLDRVQMIESEWRLRVQNTGASAESALEARYPSQDSGSEMTIGLTTREQEVLTLLSEGLSNVQIGQALHLSARTVEKHVGSLLRKTETNNRAELVRFAMEHHLVG